jgi:hypothetical protein
MGSLRAGGGSSGAKRSPGNRWPMTTISPMSSGSPPSTSTATLRPGFGDAHPGRIGFSGAALCTAYEEQRNKQMITTERQLKIPGLLHFVHPAQTRELRSNL